MDDVLAEHQNTLRHLLDSEDGRTKLVNNLMERMEGRTEINIRQLVKETALGAPYDVLLGNLLLVAAITMKLTIIGEDPFIGNA